MIIVHDFATSPPQQSSTSLHSLQLLLGRGVRSLPAPLLEKLLPVKKFPHITCGGVPRIPHLFDGVLILF